MIDSIETIYDLFSLTFNCMDYELRRAYRRAIRMVHPDLNPENIEESTIETQRLTQAYSTFKEYRSKVLDSAYLDALMIDSDQVSITFDFKYQEDCIKDIANW